MKTLILATALLAATTSFAQLSNVNGDTYRQYKAELTATDGGTKIVYLQVNTKTNDYAYGDSDIVGHGFLESSITGRVIENGKACAFSTVYFQAKFDNSQRFNSAVKTCSGLVLEFNSPEALLSNKNTTALTKDAVTKEYVGSAKVKFEGIKEVLTSIPQDRR